VQLTSPDLAFPPAERFGAFVMPAKEGFYGLAQLIFGFEATSVECLALQQAEYDLNLVSANWRTSA
jgi:hypothetical protein